MLAAGAPLLIALLPQSAPPAMSLWNLLPAPLAAAATPVLQAAVGERAVVRELPAGELDAAAAAATAPVLLCGLGEHRLRELAANGRLLALPASVWPPGRLPPRARAADATHALLLVSPRTLAYDAAAVAAADVPHSWIELATSPLADHQLALCGPEVDAAAWLGWMSLRLAAGGTEADGYALWTALDARAVYFGSYADAAQALLGGSVRFAVLPRALARRGRELQGLPPLPVRDPDDGQPAQWLGVGVLRAGAGAANGDVGGEASAAVAPLLLPALRQRLAAAVGMEPVASADDAAAAAPPLPADAAGEQRWLAHFAAQLRGQGRSLEQLDGWLDLVFTLLFLGFVWLVWRRLRRSESDVRTS